MVKRNLYPSKNLESPYDKAINYIWANPERFKLLVSFVLVAIFLIFLGISSEIDLGGY